MFFVLKCNFKALVPLAMLPIKLPKVTLLNQGHCKFISEQTTPRNSDISCLSMPICISMLFISKKFISVV